ncbi:MAG: hypothetical protein GY788_26470 [bacterium]|nr:hypothetical protein [bacterium]
MTLGELNMGNDGSTKGTGWIKYSGIMLVVAGAASIVDAIWAFRYDDTLVDLVLLDRNLAAWGWIWMILGLLLIAAGIGVMNQAQWARWTGVVLAAFAVVSNLSWAEAQPQQGLRGALLAMLVIYGLVVYGEE